jgi:hypothetical protein
MPVEIKELHIRVSVNASPGEPPAGGQPAAPPAGGGGQEGDKDAIVAECVEQVMEILQYKAER